MRTRIRKVDASLDRQILTGMIVSDEFLAGILLLPIYKPEFFLTPFAVTVAYWCSDYYEKYKKAPRKHIQDIFKSKERDNSIADAQIDEIEQFLFNLSGEYEQAEKFEVNFLLDKAREEFEKRSLQNTGQESATPDSQSEKRMFNRLLQDAKKGIFDAVIVCHTDRWSRDNKKSKEGVEILKASGVRFFTGTTELDLFNPAHEMQLGVLTEFNEYAAKRLALASLLARIASAREQSDKGLSPENLRLPFARYREQDGKWALDERKAELVRAAVDLYLDAENGKGVEPISKIVGIDHFVLNRVFGSRLGDTWYREFKSKKFNISESVKYTIPAIIEDPKKIQAVLDKMQKNKTFTHANRKKKYLLSKFVLCAECGSSFSGATPNKNGKRYYSHLDQKRSKCIHSKPKAYVDASLLERVVISKIEDLFLSPEAIEEKVKEHCSTPVHSERGWKMVL